MDPTFRNYNEDVFGNKSSTRKLSNLIVKFTLVVILMIVVPVAIRLSLGESVKLDWSVAGFLAFLILTLFTAAFAPKAFAQSKEWMAFIESIRKK